VVRPYGDEGLVHIARAATDSVAARIDAFVDATERALRSDRADLIARADRFLATQSWDATWTQMEQVVDELRPQQPVVQLPAAGNREAARHAHATRPMFTTASSVPRSTLGAAGARSRPR
jgi:hypothetical protein